MSGEAICRALPVVVATLGRRRSPPLLTGRLRCRSTRSGRASVALVVVVRYSWREVLLVFARTS